MIKHLSILAASLLVAQSPGFAADSVTIAAVEPTPLFPRPAESEPSFRWLGTDGKGALLMRSMPCGGYGQYPQRLTESSVQNYLGRHGAKWPYDAVLLPEGDDFVAATLKHATDIKAWNENYTFPRIICGTFPMFYKDIEAQAAKNPPKTFEGDSNNEWSDQDYAAAKASGLARKTNQALPAAETLATVAQAAAGSESAFDHIDP